MTPIKMVSRMDPMVEETRERRDDDTKSNASSHENQ